MRSAVDDGRLQIAAAASLLENSRLVQWNSASGRFLAVQRGVFESSWRHKVDPVFGRFACWILFAAGAEFLAKGVCLVRNIEIRKVREVPAYPNFAIGDWASEFLRNSKGDLVPRNGATKGVGHLNRLCEITRASMEQRELLLAGYGLLRETIRNRDAHAYVPNVRDSHHWLVEELFCKCFDLLVAWLPKGPKDLEMWRAEAASIVSSVSPWEEAV